MSTDALITAVTNTKHYEAALRISEDAAAKALGYPSVAALQSAIAGYCGR
jgi:hypothetical protein